MNTAITDGEADIVVIIPHCDDLDRLSRCLTALEKGGTEGADIVVVDNGSTVSLEPIREAHPDIRVVLESEKGAGPARNRGVKESNASILAFLDADCVPEADWLRVARELGRNGEIVGGRVDVFDETAGPRTGAEAFETVFAFHTRDYVERKGFSVSANLVVPRAVFESVGGFINGLSEDVDWSHRAVEAGFRLRYADELRVAHPTRADWPALARKWRRLTQEGYALNGEGLGARLRWAFKGMAMPVSALVHARHPLMSSKLSGPAERWRAVEALFRLRCQRMVWMIRQSFGYRI